MARRVAALISETYADEGVAVALVDGGKGAWQVAVHFSAPPNREAVRSLVAAAAGDAAAKTLRFERVAAKDWIGASLAGLAPVFAGRFVVHGSHDRGHVPVNRIGIEIEAALAFGTGHHGTTRGCLLALDSLFKTMPPARVAPKAQRHRAQPDTTILDLGSGSGVLAIAAARALHRCVLATDIDADAVRAARANARLNRTAALVRIVQANGVAAAEIGRGAPFDLILANILLAPLLGLSAPLKRLTARGGRIVLSGIVPAQANAVIAAYRPLALDRRIVCDGWTTLVFARRRRHKRNARRIPLR